jgi:hypothetical protein
MSTSTEIRISFPDLTTLEVTLGSGSTARDLYAIHVGQTFVCSNEDAFREINLLRERGVGSTAFRVALSALFEINCLEEGARIEDFKEIYGSKPLDAYAGFFLQIRHLD